MVNIHSLEEIEQIRINVARVYSLRTDIAKQRQKAIALLGGEDYFERTGNPEAEKILERCINDDKRLLPVIKKGISEMMSVEENLISWAESAIKNKDTKRRIVMLFEITHDYNQHLPLIEERMAAEQKLLSVLQKTLAGNIKSLFKEREIVYERYMSLWESELKEEERILTKSVDVIYESTNDRFFKQSIALLKNSSSHMMKTGAMASLFLYPLNELAPSKMDLPSLIIQIVSLAAALGIVNTFSNRHDVFLQLHKQQILDIAKMKHSLNKK